ncbi:hypothetical protein GCM10010387_29870 [Streptomyces inusitatus]|uniref:Uncharacterized protein n=1 Tax=Streptomyces inusitatus TaxID=68221 RepID=A0A918Q6G9_9ACTN|nr:hypothetical protein [Streptomyces inusitatus]GGZ33703.1 hypothetical protein GCM10010387_29870 [Streptomyces inusitatus]
MSDHPHLGWNPTPGSPPAIAALRTGLASSAASLATAHRLLDQLLGESSFWHGQAADAFRTALDGELPRYLRDAHRSVSHAARELSRWHDDLLSLQATARRYDTRAGLCAQTLTHARTHELHLRAAPSTPPHTLRTATTAVTDAQDALDSVLRLARELEEEHHARARRIAKSLDEAVERLAPEEPGVLGKVLKWVEEDLGDLLSDVSAIAGFLALVIGPFFAPAGLALLFVATGASLGALALHSTDPKVQRSLKNGFTKGEFDAEFWDNAVTLTGDALGSVPGLASIAQGAKSATAAAHTAQAVAGSGITTTTRAGAQGFGNGTVSAMDEMRQVENPLTSWALRRTPEPVQRTVKYALPASGAATAMSHYGPWSDDETVSHGATAVDGARAALDDGPGSAAKAARVWTSLNR